MLPHFYKFPLEKKTYISIIRIREFIMSKFVCDLCGYVYDPSEGVPDKGVAAGTDFSALPADWKCPMCEEGTKAQFDEVK